ncbi:hypothetical protein [Sorangium sp. So ce590]|uniref:hypothetical protein n=1 Tax=unclassified Sorangium TaxID=2621164 RepID=UPI003F625A8F
MDGEAASSTAPVAWPGSAGATDELRADEFKRTRFKARLQRVAEFRRHGAPKLKDEFLRYLHERDASFLHTLEGHGEERKGLQARQVDPSPDYSPLVHKQLDNFVFKPFEVYALRAG